MDGYQMQPKRRIPPIDGRADAWQPRTPAYAMAPLPTFWKVTANYQTPFFAASVPQAAFHMEWSWSTITTCGSARGPDADRHDNLLKSKRLVGSQRDAVSQRGLPSMFVGDDCKPGKRKVVACCRNHLNELAN
jgi:hypothetical protein